MQWYLFNDHTVTKASSDDIERAYGGITSSRGYYSSMYSRYGWSLTEYRLVGFCF